MSVSIIPVKNFNPLKGHYSKVKDLLALHSHNIVVEQSNKGYTREDKKGWITNGKGRRCW